jgi:hypothetical protein
MLVQLAIIVLLAAIVIFFSKEFGEYIKKVLNIPVLGLILPIALVSSLVVYFNDWVLWGVLTFRYKLHACYLTLVNLATFTGNTLIAGVCILMIFSVLPIVLINFYCKRSFYKEFEHRYIASALLWIFCANVLVF